MSSVVDAVFKMHQMRLNRESDTEGWFSKIQADRKGNKIQGLRERLKEYAKKVYEWHWRKDNQLARNGSLQTEEDEEWLSDKLQFDIQPFIKDHWDNSPPDNISAIANANPDDFFMAARTQIPTGEFTLDQFRKKFATFAMSDNFQAELDDAAKRVI